MRFIDLFAGLGGFHLALRKLGHECVFACEIDENLRNLYVKNFDIQAAGDIRKINLSDIPCHEILCAGFPCQPFSKAGRQEGFDHPELGDLYLEILKIISFHHPRFLILENVPNLQRHGNGETYNQLELLLRKEGYEVTSKKLSPHKFGIPQIRERIYIVGAIGSLNNFIWPEPDNSYPISNIKSILDQNPKEARCLSEYLNRCLSVWQEFLDRLPIDEIIPHPLWSMEFGATYPYEDTTPSRINLNELRNFRGSFGNYLFNAKDKDEGLSLLPSHAQRDQDRFPEWKKKFIRKNREFYIRNNEWLDLWIPKIRVFPSSFQKLEWNCQGESDRQLKSYILQIRPSGVRVKRPTTSPSLVAMTSTQVPIIAWENRYMTPTECKRLQSMDELNYLPENNSSAYEALGNAVNVDIVQRIAFSLVGKDTGVLKLV